MQFNQNPISTIPPPSQFFSSKIKTLGGISGSHRGSTQLGYSINLKLLMMIKQPCDRIQGLVLLGDINLQGPVISAGLYTFPCRTDYTTTPMGRSSCSLWGWLSGFQPSPSLASLIVPIPEIFTLIIMTVVLRTYREFPAYERSFQESFLIQGT
jgi:hypothetical protein